MSSTQATDRARQLISQETVDLVMSAISDYCTHHDLRVVTRSAGPYPTSKLERMRILKERCNLEYPLLEKDGHFHTGVVLTIQDGNSDNAVLYFKAVTEHDPELVGRAGEGLVDLTKCQESHHVTGKETWIFTIETAIRIAMTEDDLSLGRYKNPRRS